MKKLLTAVIAASMLMPIATLASSTRPGSSFKTYPVLFEPAWCIGEEEEFDRECDIVINEDGVTTPDGHIIDVKQWIMTGEKYDIGKGIVGGAAGTAAGITTSNFVLTTDASGIPKWTTTIDGGSF